MAQASALKSLLSGIGQDSEIVPVVTRGDKGERFALGAFVGELQNAVLSGEVDIALHCLKDIPTEPVEGLKVMAYLPRDPVEEAWISRTRFSPEHLPTGFRVGTGSLRRTTQLKLLAPQVETVPLVGNIDTRLSKVLGGEYDAILLAIAGPHRMGWLENWGDTPYHELLVEPISADRIIPAAGQGTLIIEGRIEDAKTENLVSNLNSADSQTSSIAERALLATLGGGCSTPVGVHATVKGGTVTLRAVVCDPSSPRVWREEKSAPVASAQNLGENVAAKLLESGAGEVLEEVKLARMSRAANENVAEQGAKV